MIYNKKIKRFFPKKPKGIFQVFLNEKRGLKRPVGENSILYWRNKYNELKEKEKQKYIEIYNNSLKDYNKKIELFHNKIFDFPKLPKNPFSYYITSEFKKLSKKNPNFNIKDNFQILCKNWYENKVNKNIFEELANKDKKRYKYEIIQFEKMGYYDKKNLFYNGKEFEEDFDEKFESAVKIKKKILSSDKDNIINKQNKKSYSLTYNKNKINNKKNQIKKGKIQYEK